MSTRSAPDRSARRSPPPTEPAPLGAPLLLINLKSYPAALGPGGIAIATSLASQGRERGVPVAVAPPMPDLARVAAQVQIPVVAQQVDAVAAGATTGWVPAEALRAAGARGSLLNHSEHPLSTPAVALAQSALLREELVPIVCARSVGQARTLARLHPPYLAVEPPELIGGNRSVSTARPEVVSGTVDAVRTVAPATRVLCGAGVHSGSDVRRAIELGSAGVLVSSAVARARDPGAAIAELLSGF